MQHDFCLGEPFAQLRATPICRSSTLPMEERRNLGEKMLSSVVTDLRE